MNCTNSLAEVTRRALHGVCQKLKKSENEYFIAEVNNFMKDNDVRKQEINKQLDSDFEDCEDEDCAISLNLTSDYKL